MYGLEELKTTLSLDRKHLSQAISLIRGRSRAQDN